MTSVATCDHDFIRSKTLGKLLSKCAGCDSCKKWPWVKMAKCRHCKKLWHWQCVPSRTLSPTEDVGCESPAVSTVTEIVCYSCVWTSTTTETEVSVERLPPVVDTVPEEGACSVPVVKTATEGVCYSGVRTSMAAKPEMPEILPAITVTLRNGGLPPDTEEVKKEIESLPVVDSSNVTNEVEKRKEILDFIKYVATTLTTTNLRLIDVKVLKLRVTSKALLEELTELIVQQALIRTKYIPQYAKLCARMVQDEAFNATPRDLDRTFEDVLVQKCRKLYSLLTGTVSKTIWINKEKLSAFFVFVKLLRKEGALSDDVARSFAFRT